MILIFGAQSQVTLELIFHHLLKLLWLKLQMPARVKIMEQLPLQQLVVPVI